MRWITRTAVLAVVVAGLMRHAWAAESPPGAALAAHVDGKPIHVFSVDAMLKSAPRQDRKPTAAEVLETMIADRLLAAWARRSFDRDELHPSSHVGFARDVAIDDQLVSTLRGLYRRELDAAVRALPGGSLEGLIVAQADLDRSRLDGIFGAPSGLRLEYALTAGQQAAARRIELLRFKPISGRERTLSLYDVYRRQNVQGRIEFHNRNPEFILQQARVAMAGWFVRDWAQRRFGEQAVDDLRAAIADREDARAAMTLFGIGHTETESRLQARLARQVKPAEIAAYYERHKEHFKRVERVKARHIRVPDEASGNEVMEAVARGEDFGRLAMRYSIAPDRESGGDLGWIVHQGIPDWLASLALVQPQGQVSRPLRTPVGPHEKAEWEIVLVEQRVEGYQAPDSEAVRYAATKAIAHEKALSRFRSLRERLLRNARVEIHRQALEEPLRFPEERL
ncbi:MAG TPA: peptidylprolyl isomerase [Paucimonas sp.]|nr:peptidylprolyl isomerase [Paucimonas sp.]